MRIGGPFDGVPELQQVVHVPLQFFKGSANTGGAGDEAGPLRYVEAIHDVAQFLAFFAFDATRDAAATRVVGHEHQVAACQRDEGGEGSTLVAAFVLLDLDDQFLANGECVLDAGFGGLYIGLEVGAGDFLEGQKAVPFIAVVDKGGFEAGLDAGDDGFVDVALALFLGG